MQDLDQNNLIAGRYRLKQSLGKGSYGEVFYAEDIQFNPPRAVALKMLHPQHISDEQVREDIRREASTLARFDHPNILRVIDFNVSPEVAFIVTELAQGGSLARKLRPDPTKPPVPMSLPEVALYLDQIADALDDAHAQGLVHRDIKPQNILLDRRGRPLVADFGLAATVNNTSSSMLIDTSTSGTPLYMAPEQWQGRAGKASDIYALGAVVYQMITGLPPYLGNQYELLGQHLNSPVPPLSERAPQLVYPPELDAVIAGAMAKDTHQRTRPAKELARRFREVVEQWQPGSVAAIKPVSSSSSLPSIEGNSTGLSADQGAKPDHADFLQAGNTLAFKKGSSLQPLAATDAETIMLPKGPSGSVSLPPTVPTEDQSSDLARKPGRRTPVGLLIGLALLIVAVAAIGLFLVLGGSKKADNTPTAVVAQDTKNASGLGLSPISSLTTEPVTTVAPTTTLVTTVAPVTTAYPTTVAPTTAPATTLVPTVPPFGSALGAFTGHTNLVLSVAFSPDSKLLATGSEDGTIKLWTVNGSKTKELRLLTGHSGPVRAVVFSSKGKYLASASADKTVKIWNVGDGKELTSLDGFQNTATSVAFSPNESLLAAGSDDKSVRMWNVATGQLVQTWNKHSDAVTSVAFSPDGKTLASGANNGAIKLWDVATGNDGPAFQGHSNFVWSVAFSPDGKTLASGSGDKTIKLWDVATGSQQRLLSNYSKGVRQVAFSPNGQYLASGSDEGLVVIWDLTSYQVKSSLRGHSDIVYSVAFSPDGKYLASGSGDKTLRLWSTR